jgi:hypothetical protein
MLPFWTWILPPHDLIIAVEGAMKIGADSEFGYDVPSAATPLEGVRRIRLVATWSVE